MLKALHNNIICINFPPANSKCRGQDIVAWQMRIYVAVVSIQVLMFTLGEYDYVK